MEWISVEDKKPIDGQECLVYRPNAHLKPNYDPNTSIKKYNAKGWFSTSSVQPTHWMPLPDPPPSSYNKKLSEMRSE